jgi:hypothetical protein
VNADRIYIFLAVLVALFSGSAFAMMSFTSLQWQGMDGFIWPAALALWVAVVIALLFAFTPYGKRKLQGGALFFLSYVGLLLYGMAGLATLILLPLRLASGI